MTRMQIRPFADLAFQDDSFKKADFCSTYRGKSRTSFPVVTEKLLYFLTFNQFP